MVLPEEPFRARLSWRLIWLGWLVVVLTYIPAAMIAAAVGNQPVQLELIPLQIAASFLPWVPVTPLVVGLCRRYPLDPGQGVRSLAALAGAGLIILPATAWTGAALAHLLTAALISHDFTVSPGQFALAASATTLFMLPVYATLVGAGQTLAYIDRDRARERHMARIRLDALRAQVEPHFLFNILNAIAALTHSDAGRADGALTELAGMLRRSLSDERGMIPLAEEIVDIRGELTLHRLLVSGELSFETVVRGEAGQALVPARLLRPLIENAITHALVPAGGGAIELGARTTDRRLVIEIANDLSAEPSRPGLGSGLAQVREHLHVIYGDRATLNDDVAAGRFRVILSLPLQPMAENAA